MQVFARDGAGQLVTAAEALREETYHCPECGGAVRLRGGQIRQRHFYHAGPSECRQEGKSAEHLQAQLTIQAALPGAELEVPIGRRIADILWGRLVYEVQCSPITAAELLERSEEYENLGLQVIWIFHEKRFNRRRVSAAESVLREKTFLYTNIDRWGRGRIYSQGRTVVNGTVRQWGRKERVDLAKPPPPADRHLKQATAKRSWYRELLAALNGTG